MAGFEPSKAYIDQGAFVEAADGLLAKAENPDTELREAVGAAQEVLTQLGNIASEKLVVQPPLSDEQIAGYNKTASTVVGVGQKALGALETADAKRETTKQGDTVEAKGDEAKSSSTPKPTPKPPTPPASGTQQAQSRRRGRRPKQS